ncbi:hypothetical protein DB345_20405 [Spartobacteria bacterium LR76]|nr:hypothetical protein DB345_20405 [Spartobacteria bacterium LR76]
MKRAICALSLLGLVAYAHSNDNRGEEILQNGSFEDGLTAWKVPASGVALRNDAGSAASGEAFVVMTIPEGRTLNLIQPLGKLEAGQKYLVSLKARNNSSSDARLIIRNLLNGKYLNSGTIEAGDNWTALETTFTAPADGSPVSLEISFRSSGSCEIDDVQVTRLK